MGCIAKLSIHWRVLNNGKIGPQLPKRIVEDTLAAFYAASLQDIGRRLQGQTCVQIRFRGGWNREMARIELFSFNQISANV
jgi:hypothetical protein